MEQKLMLEWITAIAAAVAAFSTTGYLIATIFIFRETRKSANAAADAVKAAKDNADAAKQSAFAAQSSASAAAESAGMMRQEFHDQANIRTAIVQTTIDSAVDAIQHWRDLNIRRLAASSIPDPDDLVPLSASAAVENARRISSEAASKLSSAFDDLRKARRELDGVRISPLESARPLEIHFAATCDRFDRHLASALAKLMDVRKFVT